MRMTLQQLREHGHRIDAADIVSIEGKHYMARLKLDEQWYVLSDNEYQTLLMPSTYAMNDMLDDAGVAVRRDLIHQSPYNEMIGLDEVGIDPLRVPTRGA